MTLSNYLLHYLDLKGILLMFATAAASIAICLIIIRMASIAMAQAKNLNPNEKRRFIKEENDSLTDRFYELIFSSTTILLFVGIYFTIDYFGAGIGNTAIWAKYNSFILLFFILFSVILNSLIDSHLIPLENMRPGEQASMRLIGMLYMLIVFAYIKFIYNDNNYDYIILYFLTLVIGRFVYFDASIESFHHAIAEAARSLPLLLLVLLCSILMAYVGFSSNYLLNSNGVVLSLFFAHLFLLVVIFIVHWVRRLLPSAS